MNLKSFKKFQERQEAIKALHATLGHKNQDQDEEIEIPQKPKSKERIAIEKKLMQTMGHDIEEDDSDDEDE